MSNLQHASVGASPPSFIDLREFADDKTLGAPSPVGAESDDRFLRDRRLLDLPPGPVTCGVIALEAGSGTVQSLPADEFVIVHEGALTITRQDGTLVLGANDSAVLQQGVEFGWSAEGPVSLIFMRYGGGTPGEGGLTPIIKSPTLEPSGPPLAELLVGPTPACRNHTDYRSPDGVFTCGTWDSTPYHRRAMSYRHYELMYLLEGSVTFEDETGRRGTFSKGDIFLVEQHAQCSWESREHVAKVYAIYRPL
ncbi:cupin domain-containing protein [Pseudoduganella namucuonensis]|uniref:Predicted enzyme of the cupin superfamily n=1 Tax=Pseudoduganella namucuonensis TaxID=1035707 RepID=A0A1I7JFB3_9BURK|nr:cupin domain-containing protein [Pseudoduganella namucuonensis]SFU83817.1 Predicted enzyme of the cupin superfamily [Pseudoduganella namucuonensis]